MIYDLIVIYDLIGFGLINFDSTDFYTIHFNLMDSDSIYLDSIIRLILFLFHFVSTDLGL